MTTTENDRYKRLEEIGKGGMGIVWEALDTKLGRKVALKDLDISMDRLEDRRRWFEREVSIQAKLKHDAILEVYEYVDDDKEHPFYTMQLVSRGPKGEKPSIHERLKVRQFVVPEILDIARQLAHALHYLWTKGIVHRDLKPANLLLENRADGTARLLIADFGLAVSRDQAEATVTRLIRGTPEYWAPEQKAGRPADYPMDIWGFGAVIHTLLTGRAPKHDESFELSDHHDVPREFAALVVDCLRMDPMKRPVIADVVARVDAVLRASQLGSVQVIGREKELAQLERFLDESRAKAHFALIGGRPGIGKRHLVESLCRRAKSAGILVLRGVVTGDRLAPYVALCQVIEDYFHHAQEPADFSDLAPDLTEQFPLLKEIPKLATQTSPSKRQPTSALYALLASAFRRMAAQQHMLVVVENLHLGSVSVEAIRRIVAQGTNSKFLLVATYDNSAADALSALREDIRSAPSVYSDITLRPLTEGEDRRLIAELLGSDQIATETITVTREHCGGIPLITTLLVVDARNRRDLVQGADGVWQFRADAEISAQSLPDVQELIDRSCDRLSETHRKLIDHASVAIDTFTMPELGCLTSRRGKRLEEDVNSLIKADLLKEERPGRFAFARRAVRERVHDRLDGTLRKVAHRKLGIYREQNRRETDNIDGYLWRHFQEAGIRDKALEYGLKHAEYSLQVRNPRAAIVAARAVLEESSSDRATGKAHHIVAQALRMLDNVAECLESVALAFSFHSRAGEQEEACAAAMLGVETAWHGHRMYEVGRWLRAGLPLARELGNPAALATFLYYEATSEALRGEDARATAAAQQLSALNPSVDAPGPPSATLRVPLGMALHSIDPTTSNLRWTADIASLVFETLTRIDDCGRPVPWLASEVSEEPGYRRYTFRMRDDVTFHDGTPCTAHDVKWSFERLLRRAKPLHQMLPDDIVGGEAVASGIAPELAGLRIHEDGMTFSIELGRPLPAFPRMLSDPAFCIVPHDTEDFPIDFAHGLVGTGPYLVEKFSPGKQIVLRASARHWRPAYPRTREIVISLGLTPEVIANGFRAGDYSIAFDLTQKEHDSLRLDQKHDWYYDRTPTLSTCFAAFNVTRERLQNISVREALIAAMDVESIAEGVRGMAIPAYGLFPPALLEVGQKHRVFDSPTLPMEKLTAVCSSSFAAAFPGMVESIVRRLSKDVEVKLVEMTSPELQRAPDADIYFGYFTCDYPDLDGFALPLLHSQTGVLGRICGSAEIDAMLVRGREEGRPQEFQSLYRDLHQHITELSLICPLFHPFVYCFAGPSVSQIRLRNFFPSVRYDEVVVR